MKETRQFRPHVQSRQAGGISASVITALMAAAVLSATTGADTAVAQGTTSLRAAGKSSTAAAWALPDPDQLVSRVFTRIVTQDKPNAIPVASYTQKLLGKQETIAAVRRFAGHSVDLRPSAFQAVAGWSEVPRADYHPCAGESCETPVNSLWLAITKIERGELPHELHVWYTTSFASEGPAGVASETYSFCERWLRVNGTWKYDGFVRVDNGD